MYHRAKHLTGFTVSAKDVDVGRIHDLYFDDQSWIARYLVIDTGTWFSGKRVLISPVTVEHTDWNQRILHVMFSSDQIRNSPSVDVHKPVSVRQMEEIHEHYAWPAFRMIPMISQMSTGFMPAPGSVIMNQILPEEMEGSENAEREEYVERMMKPTDTDIHLRSANETEGYHIGAEDGHIGHVQDFLIDPKTWAIGYIVVDTRDWIPGKVILLPPMWISQVDWTDRTVYIKMFRDLIQSSPEYNESIEVNQEYEEKLYRHYGRPKTWI